MNDTFVRLIALPDKVRGFVKEDPDGNYNIYLNEKDSLEAQRQTYAHEMRHILLGHLRRDKSLEECEEEAERGYGEQGKEAG